MDLTLGGIQIDLSEVQSPKVPLSSRSNVDHGANFTDSSCHVLLNDIEDNDVTDAGMTIAVASDGQIHVLFRSDMTRCDLAISERHHRRRTLSDAHKTSDRCEVSRTLATFRLSLSHFPRKFIQLLSWALGPTGRQ
jgi:hypothetical protein